MKSGKRLMSHTLITITLMILTFHHRLVSFLVCPVLLVYKQRTNDIPTNLGCTLFCANQQVLACLHASLRQQTG